MDRTAELLTAEQWRWLETLREDVWRWFQTVYIRPGRVRFCAEGALFEPGERAGLGLACLALKTLHMLNLTDRLPAGTLSAWAERIRSFQHPGGFRAGYFEDPALRKAAREPFYLPWRIPAAWQATLRAETRQACAALACIGETPRTPLQFLPKTPEAVRNYFHRLEWTNPWAAGSHAGHLMAFLRINRTLFGNDEDETRLLPVLLEELDAVQDKATGCWRKGQPTPQQLINGAMKVITGYAYLNLPFAYPERLIDFALSLQNDHDACHHADLIYVLHQCARLTDYRREDIQQVAAQRLAAIMAFRKPDGAFSFREHSAGTNYYGAPMSVGKPVSDIHGTTLFTWTAVMIADLLELRETLGWKLPVT